MYDRGARSGVFVSSEGVAAADDAAAGRRHELTHDAAVVGLQLLQLEQLGRDGVLEARQARARRRILATQHDVPYVTHYDAQGLN